MSGSLEEDQEHIVDILMKEWSEDERFAKIKNILLEAEGITNSQFANANKATLLHLAVKYNMHSIIKLLVNKGADINAVDNDGNTPFHYAAEAGNPETLLLLYYLGIKTNTQNKFGNTALHTAVQKFKPASIAMLLTLDAPIDRTIKNNEGRTAKMLISTNSNHSQMVKLANAFTIRKNS